MSEIKRIEKIQKILYENISEEYDKHYSDKYSEMYRNIFFNNPMFKNIDLSGKVVLEAMCGSGLTTKYLLSKGAQVVGLDLNSEFISSFKKKFPDCETIESSIFDLKINEKFDCVVISNGLHHLQPEIDRAIDIIYDSLKPLGFFCFTDPHEGSIPNFFRKLWYKCDKYCGENSDSLALSDLYKKNRTRFQFLKKKYSGTIAHLFVFNSMAFGIPYRIKKMYAPLFIFLEKIIDKFQSPFTSCITVQVWQKRN